MSWQSESEEGLRYSIKKLYNEVAHMEISSQEELQTVEKVFNVMDEVFNVRDRRELIDIEYRTGTKRGHGICS